MSYYRRSSHLTGIISEVYMTGNKLFYMDIPLKLETSWEQVKEMLKEINSDLTDDDLMYDTRQTNQLLERLSRKMNRSPEEIRTWIESVSHNKGKAS